MIRRDYLLRSIEQCVRALARVLRLTEEGQFAKAEVELDEAMQLLVGFDLKRLAALSDSELLVELLKGEPTQVLREKGLLLVALLERAGDIDAAQSRLAPSGLWYVRALNLQLQILSRDGSLELPQYVPKVEALARKAKELLPRLPAETSLALMQYYERTGQFAKAEDELFASIENRDPSTAWIEFGIQFYERLLRQSDLSLELGDLPRPEVQAGLAELKSRMAS